MSIRAFREGLNLENLKILLDKTPFTAFLRPEVLKCEEGYAELHVQLRPDLTQHHGYAHGAVIGCVADSACAWAAGSVAGDVVTSEYKLHLLAPGVGDKLIGRGYVVKAFKSFVVARSEVFAAKNDKERLIAIATATVAVVQ
jgi:uncharacterized protein (TIGR00369 family)